MEILIEEFLSARFESECKQKLIIYNETTDNFMNHIRENKIGYVLKENVYEKANKAVSPGELRSWENSLPQMAKVIRDADINNGARILLEYKLPSTEKRIDFIIAGENATGKRNVMIVELKQWGKAAATDGDGIVRTFLGGRERETVHPSYQATSYKKYLLNFNESLYNDSSVHLSSCAYLHNYIKSVEKEPLLEEIYTPYLNDSPIYFEFDDRELSGKINQLVSRGNGKRIADAIETSKIRPSKKLVETVNSLMQGNEEFVLLDEQKIAYEKVITLYEKLKAKTEQKHALIIKGGPGTGKSVIGLNLMSYMLSSEANVEYITPNQAFREVLRKKLIGKSHSIEVRNLFKGSASYVDTPSNYFDVLVCDEAHRLKNQGHMKPKIEGENQITQIMRASQISVFFIDDSQQISKKDIGSIEAIKQEAVRFGIEPHEIELESQYRCAGSGNYLSWIDSVLGFKNEKVDLEGDFDFRVVSSPHELIGEVVDNKAGRVMAGYAWKWNKERVNGELLKDVVIEEHDFAMPWNDANRIDWAINPECAYQIGCIHTVQGLEMDYVGVIIGKDLGYDSETDSLVVRREEFRDNGARPAKPKKGEKDPLDELVRNTYKTLMTRGMKGCYVYCCDKELEQYLINRMA